MNTRCIVHVRSLLGIVSCAWYWSWYWSMTQRYFGKAGCATMFQPVSSTETFRIQDAHAKSAGLRKIWDQVVVFSGVRTHGKL
jgi:hypothetical protein